MLNKERIFSIWLHSFWSEVFLIFEDGASGIIQWIKLQIPPFWDRLNRNLTFYMNLVSKCSAMYKKLSAGFLDNCCAPEVVTPPRLKAKIGNKLIWKEGRKKKSHFHLKENLSVISYSWDHKWATGVGKPLHDSPYYLMLDN